MKHVLNTPYLYTTYQKRRNKLLAEA